MKEEHMETSGEKYSHAEDRIKTDILNRIVDKHVEFPTSISLFEQSLENRKKIMIDRINKEINEAVKIGNIRTGEFDLYNRIKNKKDRSSNQIATDAIFSSILRDLKNSGYDVDVSYKEISNNLETIILEIEL